MQLRKVIYGISLFNTPDSCLECFLVPRQIVVIAQITNFLQVFYILYITSVETFFFSDLSFKFASH